MLNPSKQQVLHAALNMQQLARKREEQLGMLDYDLRVAHEDLAELKVSLNMLVQSNKNCLHTWQAIGEMVRFTRNMSSRQIKL